jgi:hypothetical protein
MGWPTKLVYTYTGDKKALMWEAMAKGETHLWPEVWRSESDGLYYSEFVLTKETCASAGKKTRPHGHQRAAFEKSGLFRY